MADERGQGRSPADQRGGAGPERHAVDRAPTPGPGGPADRPVRLGSRGGRQRLRRRDPFLCGAVVRAVTLASAWWTPRRVEGRRRHATSGSGRPVAAFWPSVTPTTWCGQVGSPPCWRPWPTPIWSPGCSTSASLNGRPTSNPIPAATRQLGFLPFALGANLAVRREVFEAVHGFCEELLNGGEDIDLSWRLQLAGYRFAVTARCRRGETRAHRCQAACSGRLGLRTVRAACSTGATVRTACGATYGARPRPGSGWWSTVPGWSARRDAVSGCARSAYAPGRLTGSVRTRVLPREARGSLLASTHGLPSNAGHASQILHIRCAAIRTRADESRHRGWHTRDRFSPSSVLRLGSVADVPCSPVSQDRTADKSQP